MCSNKPTHFKNILDKLDKSDHESNLTINLNHIPKQCGKNADPLYQDFRFGTICDPYEEFLKRGISKEDLIEWKREIPIIYPWDPEYDLLRQNVNRRFTIFPWAIVMCKKEKHALIAFNKCQEYNIPLCIRGGAHCYEPYSLCDGIVIDQSRRIKVEVNEKEQTVTIEPGCLNGPTADILSKYKLVLPAGTCANVGIVGLTLGGGKGFLARKYGLTCDNLKKLDMITAKGETITVNKKTHPELFWAHQGGGGNNFGIVTSLTYKVHPIEKVIVFELWWNVDNMYEVMSKWLEWGPTSDHNLTTELDIYALNENNKNPYPILITGLYLGTSKTKLKKILEPLLKLNPQDIKISKTDYLDSARHFTYSKFPAPFFKNKSTYIIKQLPKEVIPVIKKYMKKAGPNDRLEFNGLGGAYDDVEADETAYPHRKALAWLQFICRWGSNVDNHLDDCDTGTAAWEDYLMGPIKLKWVKEFYDEFKEVAGKSLSGAYVNCPDSDLKKWPRAYYGENLEKLIKIKKKWDRKKIFSFPQGLSQLY